MESQAFKRVFLTLFASSRSALEDANWQSLDIVLYERELLKKLQVSITVWIVSGTDDEEDVSPTGKVQLLVPHEKLKSWFPRLMTRRRATSSLVFKFVRSGTTHLRCLIGLFSFVRLPS